MKAGNRLALAIEHGESGIGFKAEVKDARDDSLAPISLVEENEDLKAKLAQALAENEEMKARLAEQPETPEAHAPAGKGKK